MYMGKCDGNIYICVILNTKGVYCLRVYCYTTNMCVCYEKVYNIEILLYMRNVYQSGLLIKGHTQSDIRAKLDIYY